MSEEKSFTPEEVVSLGLEMRLNKILPSSDFPVAEIKYLGSTGISHLFMGRALREGWLAESVFVKVVKYIEGYESFTERHHAENPFRINSFLSEVNAHRNVAAHPLNQARQSFPHVYSSGTLDGTYFESSGDPRPLHYMVLELVPGENAEKMLMSRKISPSAKQRVLVDAGLGFDIVHKAGLVHMDVKPENIIEDRRTRLVKVVDLGFAVPIGGGYDSTFFVGTAGYIAPEFSREGVYDHRSDIYSFGVLLFTSFAGKHPFHSMGFDRDWNHIVMEKAAMGHIKRMPSDVAKWGVEEIAHICLQPDPDERYPAFEPLVEDLKSCKIP